MLDVEVTRAEEPTLDVVRLLVDLDRFPPASYFGAITAYASVVADWFQKANFRMVRMSDQFRNPWLISALAAGITHAVASSEVDNHLTNDL